MGASETEAILADLAGIVRLSGKNILQAGQQVAGSVDVTREAAGQYTDKLCASLDAFRLSMDRNSRVTSWLTGALIFFAAVSAFGTVMQALGW